MIRNEGGQETGGSDAQDEGDRPRLHWRLRLGALILAVLAGYVVFKVGLGSIRGDFDVLVVVLGGCLSGTLLGEYSSERFRSVMLGCNLHPAIELLVTYGLVGVVVLAVLGGYLVVAAVSGVLLVCNFVAMIKEDACFSG